MPSRRSFPSTARPWGLLIALLLILRIPAFAAPTGNDQSLYLYVADRIREGGAPYVDAWDQKPPAVHFLYAGLRTLWPHTSVVAAADLLAAALVAWLLVLIARRIGHPWTGVTAAGVYLLLSDPSLQRLDGVYVRGQCEAFIALAVTAAVALTTGARRERTHWILAGVALAVALWLKYNAMAYVLVVGLGLRSDGAGVRLRHDWRAGVSGLLLGAAAVSLGFLGLLGVHGALDAWWKATVQYNLDYAGESYGGLGGAVTYLLQMPIARARLDLLWFLGLAGLATVAARRHPAAPLLLAWVASTMLAIVLNGARDLPQYFVQASPALALAAALGLHVAWSGGRILRVIAVLVLALGLWRVGSETPGTTGLRWGGLPQLVENVRFDTAYLLNQVSRATYLARFQGGQKYDAAAVADLAAYVRATTSPSDRILVFGFAPGVYVASERLSASRFFWSRPVITEFAAGNPGYGSAGLLEDLQAARPAIVALQKRDWFPDVQNSMDFFLSDDPLRGWLMAGYRLDHDTPTFSVWRRQP